MGNQHVDKIHINLFSTMLPGIFQTDHNLHHKQALSRNS